MGGGKSRIVVDYIQNVPAVKSPLPLVIIVSPLKAAENVWSWEFSKYWAGEENSIEIVDLYSGRLEVRAQRLLDALARQAHLYKCGKTVPTLVASTNYDGARQGELAKVLLASQADLHVYDECHKLKAPGGDTSIFACKFSKKTPRIIAMSGTPMSQGPQDIYAQMRVISPGLFGWKYAAFKDRYCIMGGYLNKQIKDYQNMEEFTEKLNTVTFRIGEEEVERHLPPFQDEQIRVKLPPKLMAKYKEFEEELTIDLESGASLTAPNTLVKLLRCQQLAGGFIQTDQGDMVQVHTEKFDAVTELLDGIDSKERITIFCNFTAEIKELAHLCTSKWKRPVCFLVGGKNDLPKWKITPGAVLFVQIAAGAEAVDFTEARYQFYFSQCYNWSMYTQSRKRIRRPGQTRPVIYYHIMASGTVDLDVYKALSKKESVINTIKVGITDRRRES